MKIETSISQNYCPNWSLWQGVREIIQNWLDSKDEGNEGEIKYTKSGVLHVFNSNCTIDASDIALLGESSKRKGNHRGFWGEGLAIGCLALCRDNRKVTIRSGYSVYTASIAYSNKFHKNVLMFDKRTGVNSVQGVEVKVTSLSESEWNFVRDRILPLRDREFGKISTSTGDILTDDSDRGHVYIKDIFVAKHDQLENGYNFRSGVETDRDRGMVNSFDLGWTASEILTNALGDGLDHKALLDIMSRGGNDCNYIHSHIGQRDFDKIKEAFEEENGADAVPVSTESQRTELEHYGINAVKSSPAVCKVFSERLGDFETTLKRAKTNIKRTVSEPELPQVEVLNAVLFLLESAQIPVNSRTSVVEFADDAIMGTYDSESDHIRIGLEALKDREICLKTMVEELAHAQSGSADGSMKHKEALHSIYSRIICYMKEW